MSSDTLVNASDLSGLPGAPFTPGEVLAAVTRLRADVGWHIAPVRPDTVELDVAEWEPTLRLPTRRLVSVEEVRDADTALATSPARYRVSKRLARIRRRSGFWPSGYARMEVDFTHGYDECPADLFDVIADYVRDARRDVSVQSVRVDDGSVSYFSGAVSSAHEETLLRYVIPTWSGSA